MNVYDSKGAFAGIVNDDGSIYDATGSYMGNVDSNGFVFNCKNLFVGHVSNGIHLPRVDELQPFAITTSACEVLLGSVDTEGTIYHIKPDIGSQDELRLWKVGYVSPLADFYLAGAAIWLLVEDVTFTLRPRTSLRSGAAEKVAASV